MIRQMTTLDGWQAFIEDLCADPAFSDPKLTDEEDYTVEDFRITLIADAIVVALFAAGGFFR